MSAYDRDTCVPLFIGALFTLGKLRDQPRNPSVDQQIKQMWFIHTVEYCLAIKKNEIT